MTFIPFSYAISHDHKVAVVTLQRTQTDCGNVFVTLQRTQTDCGNAFVTLQRDFRRLWKCVCNTATGLPQTVEMRL